MEMRKRNPMLSRQFELVRDSSFHERGQKDVLRDVVGKSDHTDVGSALAISVGATKLGRYGVLGHGIYKN